MPIIISGSTGISGTDGTAATPAFQGTDTNTGVFFPAADTIAFGTNGTEDFRIGPAGQFGIQGANYGTTGQVLTSAGAASPPAWQTVSSPNGVLLNVQAFISSGTYTRTAGVTRAVVIAVGGGGGGAGSGGNGGAGGTTSFGSHVSAAGGGAGLTNGTGGAGGTGGTGALIAIAGAPGEFGIGFSSGGCNFVSFSGNGGGEGGGRTGRSTNATAGVRGGGGGGAENFTASASSGGGGQGETAIDYITSVGATETVTIGAGGTAPASGSFRGGVGGAGYVIVYEYS